MKFILYILIGSVFLSCNPEKDTYVIQLSEYDQAILNTKLRKVRNAVALTITTSDSEWSIYPPCSGMKSLFENSPFNKLPSSIADLANLESLILVGLNLSELPNEFSELEKLRYLDLSFNKLNITNELEKFEYISLDTLVITGNSYDTSKLESWKARNPTTSVVNKCN